jgi:hypothetical protein
VRLLSERREPELPAGWRAVVWRHHDADIYRRDGGDFGWQVRKGPGFEAGASPTLAEGIAAVEAARERGR